MPSDSPRPSTPEYPPDPTARRRVVDGITRQGLMSQLDNEQIYLWHKLPAPKVLVYLANPYNYSPQTALLRIDSVLHIILQESSTFQIEVPDPSEFVHNARPVVHLVWKLSEFDAQTLSSHQYWSLPTNTAIFIFPWDDPPSTFNHTVSGFPYADNLLGRQTVCNIFREAIRSSEMISAFIRCFKDNFPEGVTPSVDALMASCEVTTFHLPTANVPGSFTIAWNLYIASPTRIPGIHRSWKALVASVAGAAFGNSVTCIIAHVCGLCLGVSHPTTRCLMPYLFLWYGPGIDLVPEQYLASNRRAVPHIAFAGEVACRAPDECLVPDNGSCVVGDP